MAGRVSVRSKKPETAFNRSNGWSECRLPLFWTTVTVQGQGPALKRAVTSRQHAPHCPRSFARALVSARRICAM